MDELKIDGLPEIPELPEEQEGQDPVNWKEVAEMLHSAATTWSGVARRNHAALKKSEKPVEQPKAEPKDDGQKDFDYGQLAFLVASGVPEEDHEYLKEVMAETGRELKEVLKSKVILAELKDRKELRASQEATPSGSRRTNQSARTTVDYWLSKGTDELPPNDGTETTTKLRREIIKARVALDGSRSGRFSSNPVV